MIYYYFLFSFINLSIRKQLQRLLKRFTPYLAYPHESSPSLAEPDLITAPRHGSGSSFGSGSSSGDGSSIRNVSSTGNGVFSGNGIKSLGASGGMRRALVLQPLMKSNSS